MAYEISASHVTAHYVAAVSARVNLDRVADSFRGPLDKVWAFLSNHPGLRTDGHNVFFYHHDTMSGRMETVDFGVQVTRAFADEGEVRCIETPAGSVVSTLHRGPYNLIGEAHQAMRRWLHENNKRSSCSWEIYGDWTDDPSKLETTIVYLLA